MSAPRLQIGISSCLAGNRVRYDGKHKIDYFLTGTLGRFVDLRAYCPEVAIGLGIPRPAIQLTGSPEQTRVRGVTDPSRDVTEPLWEYGRQLASETPPLDGYIFKAGSPSCGVEGVKLLGDNGAVTLDGRGAFSASVRTRLPRLPVVEESDLGDPEELERFVQRARVYRRWRDCSGEGELRALLQEYELWFQAAGLELPMSAGWTPDQYLDCLDEIWLREPARPDHARVLRQIVATLATNRQASLQQTIVAYEQGELPRAVPLALIHHELAASATETADRWRVQCYLQMDWLLHLSQ